MRIEVDITRADYADFNRYFFFRKKIKTVVLIYVFAVLLLPFFLKTEGPFVWTIFLKNIFLTALVLAVVYALVSYGGMELIGLMPSSQGIVLGKKTYTLQQDGIEEQGVGTKSFVNWANIHSVEESKGLVMVYIDTIAAHIIPIRSFENTEEKSKFIAKIRNQIRKGK